MRTYCLLEDLENLKARDFVLKVFSVIGQLGKFKNHQHNCNNNNNND